MGYQCPVCADPQADETHLANHLAFTAIARGGDHEDWLDDHVDDWGSMDEATLADHVVEFADEEEYPQVFEDTTTQDHDHPDSQGDPSTDSTAGAGIPERADLDIDSDDVDSVVDEAVELTRQRRNEDDESENE